MYVPQIALFWDLAQVVLDRLLPTAVHKRTRTLSDPRVLLRGCSSLRSQPVHLMFRQIAIINAASVIGRTIPNAIADRVGNFTTLVPIWACTSALVFVMFAATNTGAVIVFAILYGAFSGACELVLHIVDDFTLTFAPVISLLPPTLASMSRSPAEIG